MTTAMCHISCGGTNRNRRRRDVWQSCARRKFQFHEVISSHLTKLLTKLHEFSRLTCYASSRVTVLVDVLVFTKRLGSTDEW